MKADIDLLLFDLGGVVVPWVGMEALADRAGMSVEDARAHFEQSDILKGYQRGASRDAAFLDALSQRFALDAPRTVLARHWKDWVRPPFPGVIDAIRTLGDDFATACLSNTNALHWERLHELFDLKAVFDPALASHELKLAKPDPAIFQTVIDRTGVAPDRILFFDDSPENVRAARAMGMRSEPVDPMQGVLPVLKRLGLVA
ncbi:HAD family phosphatase [uncultured Algimonas sp.]|uniref:HAD family hydrolase n=1 Tax=uncultured Algimonas sp. TaxID=1547920 RepID=UPI0026128DC4|nr:HAD family phosphatase [uncultured Algimonas sp.]